MHFGIRSKLFASFGTLLALMTIGFVSWHAQTQPQWFELQAAGIKEARIVAWFLRSYL